MNLIRRNTDFCSQAVFETIGKAGGGVNHHRTGINTRQKSASTTVIFRNNGFGMTGAIAINVIDGLIHIVYDANRQDRCQIFRRPVFFGSHQRFNMLTSAFTTAQLHPFSR